ncbi:hypothetical protein ACI3QN_12790, partial [Propionibacterium freudenreichii]|uniref:hypothetical protein n=1 Tax=Propionibacterium freudenreichii TaxID=1744 RepID=UPI0038551C7C
FKAKPRNYTKIFKEKEAKYLRRVSDYNVLHKSRGIWYEIKAEIPQKDMAKFKPHAEAWIKEYITNKRSPWENSFGLDRRGYMIVPYIP